MSSDADQHDAENHDGEHHDGEHHDGEHHDGEHHDGEHHDGEHHDGEHHDADRMTVVTDPQGRAAVQPDSTVSTTVLRAQGARVVLFTFDAGQELSEHTAAVPVLIQLLSGRVTVTASGRTVELGPNDLVHLTARLPHAVVALEPSHLQLTLLDPR
jgi:quercetin dioxygenase-like cupin family protein